MNIKIKGKKESLTVSVQNLIIKHAGKLHGRYKGKKVDINKIRNLIDYSDL